MSICRWMILITLAIFNSVGVAVSSASAETRELYLKLSFGGDQRYESVIEQAESLATTAINEGFAEGSDVTEIYIQVFGETNGQEVPLIASRVTYGDWQRDPRIHRWTRYFANAGLLLGFYAPQPVQSTSPPVFFAPRPVRLDLEDTPGFRDD